jgi:hypothetical protein
MGMRKCESLAKRGDNVRDGKINEIQSKSGTTERADTQCKFCSQMDRGQLIGSQQARVMKAENKFEGVCFEGSVTRDPGLACAQHA